MLALIAAIAVLAKCVGEGCLVRMRLQEFGYKMDECGEAAVAARGS